MNGRTFWDFLTEGSRPRTFWSLFVICLFGAMVVFLLLSLGYVIIWRGEEIGIRPRTAPSLFLVTRLGTDNRPSEPMPADGFIYVSCPNNVRAEVLIEPERYLTSGKVQGNNSGMFPVMKGQKVMVYNVEPKNGDVQILYYRFRQ